jgi:proteasome accessory factor B
MSQSARTERLLNLLFALMSAGRPVPKAELRSVIAAYSESPSEEAFERMFERDKDELRGMGIPIDTVEGSDGAGGIEGYRVSFEDYALPEVELTADEATVLGIAARVWEQAALGPAAQQALRKLETSGVGVSREVVGVETRIGTAEPAFPILLDAVAARRVVSFDYRRPGDPEPAARRVEPWGVASRRGHWYLVGRDLDRSAARVFRLSRVVGAPRALGATGSYEIPADADPIAMIATATQDGGDRTAVVVIGPGAATLRRRATERRDLGDGRERLHLAYSDDEALARELVGFGAAVVVEEPESLRAAVVRRLRAIAGEDA